MSFITVLFIVMNGREMNTSWKLFYYISFILTKHITICLAPILNVTIPLVTVWVSFYVFICKIFLELFYNLLVAIYASFIFWIGNCLFLIILMKYSPSRHIKYAKLRHWQLSLLVVIMHVSLILSCIIQKTRYFSV